MSDPSDTKIKTVAITGPTADGKSAFALHAAKRFDGEIISCDSMQIYRCLDIGTAKPTVKELATCPHHLIDIVDPSDDFSAARYAAMAREAIEEVSMRGKLPVICGGTGLYLEGILYDMDYGPGPADDDIRTELESRLQKEGSLPLHRELQTLDPAAAEDIHPNNAKRIIRALERIRLGEGGITSYRSSRRDNPVIEPLLIGLEMDRAALYERINTRVDRMMDQGLLDEVSGLVKSGLSTENISMLGIGYKELIDHINGERSFEDAVEKIKTGTRHYAKRQFTWFRRYDRMNWIDISAYDSEEEAMQTMDTMIEDWLSN